MDVSPDASRAWFETEPRLSARMTAPSRSATRSPAGAEPSKGAYGIRLLGLARAQELLVDGDSRWPSLRLVSSTQDAEPVQERITDVHADLNLKTGGHVSIDRDRAIARFVHPRHLDDYELVHPYLAPAAAVVAHWLRRQCFHAGAFLSDGGAWALAGNRDAGKSSLLAWLALHGHPVLADDIVVIEDLQAFAGPRSIDLRSEAAARLGVGSDLGVVGARPRWRLALPDVGGQVPFRGWIFLAWGASVEVERLSGSECLVRLLRQRTLRVVPPDPASHLALAGLPAWELRRPREWQLAADVGQRVLELTASRA